MRAAGGAGGSHFIQMMLMMVGLGSKPAAACRSLIPHKSSRARVLPRAALWPGFFRLAANSTSMMRLKLVCPIVWD